jgi:hypothetical protein
MPIRVPLAWLAAALAVALLDPVSLLAKGQIEVVAKFQRPNLELDVATYTDPEFASPGNRVGVLGFASGPVRNSFSLRGEDWDQLTDLWAKAKRMQSRKQWRTVGTLSERGTAEVSRLTLSAGQGVRLAITSPKGASMAFLVGNAEMPRFEAALAQVKDILAK